MTQTKPYATYNLSSLPWLAQLPASWSESRLGYETWVRARLGWKGLKADEYIENGFAFLATPNIKGKEIDFWAVNFITQERYDESPEIKLAPDDVLLTKDGSTLGTVNVVRDLPRPTTVNSSIAVLSPGSRCTGQFIRYLIQSELIQQRIELLKGGMGVPHLFQDDIRRMPIPLPPLNIQSEIVSFLDRETAQIDELIGKQERLINLLAEKRQAFITQAITKGLNPGTPTKPSGIPWLGRISAHWSVRKFSQITSINGGQVDPREDPWASMTLIAPNHVVSGQGRLSYQETAAEQGADSGKYFVRAGQVIYSKIRPYLRKVITAPEDCLCSADMYGISADPAVMSNRFLKELMLSQPFTDFTADSSARVAMPKINRESLAQAFLWYPDREEQLRILSHIDRESQWIGQLEQKARRFISLLRERRSALISAAVTGNIDVQSLGESL